jgi:hypothetical protein
MSVNEYMPPEIIEQIITDSKRMLAKNLGQSFISMRTFWLEPHTSISGNLWNLVVAQKEHKHLDY